MYLRQILQRKTACDQYNLEKAKINEEKTEGIKIIQLISVLDVTG